MNMGRNVFAPSKTASPGAFKASSRGRIPELDGLRGLAILLVVLFHFITYSYHGPPRTALSYFTKLFGLGWSGVDLFFVLSGFLIGGILLDARESPRYFGTFYLRRVHRILPIYYVWILSYALIFCMPAGWFPATLEVSRSHLSVIPRYVFFLQNMAYQQDHFQWVWFAVTWSLAVEEQFYLIAPPLIRFLSTSSFAILLVAAVVFCPVLRGLVFVHLASGNYAAVMAMPCRADDLAMGILVAMAWRTPRIRLYIQGHVKLLYWLLGAALFGVVSLVWWYLHPVSLPSVTIGLSVMGLFYAVLMLIVLADTGGILASVIKSRFFRHLGGISYCVYVIHWTVNQTCHAFLLGTSPRISDWSGVSATLLAAGVTWAIATVSWRYFEKPLIRRGHRYSY